MTEHETSPVEIIVVDDGSEPQNRAEIESLNLPQTQVIAQSRAGVSAAWNRGAAAATAPFLIFLNNDTLFHAPVVEHLLAPLREGNALLTGAAFRRETALPQSILQNLPSSDFLQGWCFAVARDEFHSLGGFDDAMTLYWSDTDFQTRLLRKQSSLLDALTAVCGLPIRHRAHQTARTIPARRRIWQADRDIFIRKWNSNPLYTS